MTSTHLHTSHHDHAHHGPHKVDDQAQILDLDAQVLGEHIADITAWLPLRTPPRRIVDIGSGTGAGTFALLDRFVEAGGTLVDTADVYSAGVAEEIVGRWYADRPADVTERVVLATKGRFPTWLAPTQVKVLPVSEKTLDYASEVTNKLAAAGIRVVLDSDNDKIGYKIRQAQQVDRVPYMLVLGAKEAEAGNISVRDR